MRQLPTKCKTKTKKNPNKQGPETYNCEVIKKIYNFGPVLKNTTHNNDGDGKWGVCTERLGIIMGSMGNFNFCVIIHKYSNIL